MSDFRASNLEQKCGKIQNSIPKIKLYQIHGESGSVSKEFVELARKETREFIKLWLNKGNGRSLRDVFNAI